MDIINKIYRKELIETEDKRNGVSSKTISKRMFYLLKNPDALKVWVRMSRGKYSIDKALAIYRNGRRSQFLCI